MNYRDQAHGLRELVSSRPKRTGDTKVLAITSGKGGVGKSTISANLSYLLATNGYKVAIFDADIGLANLDVIFNVKSNKNIMDILKGHATLEDIAIKIHDNLTLIPGESGEEIINYAHDYIYDKFMDEMSSLDDLDFIIVDTGAGIGEHTQAFLKAADEVIVVTVPDPAAITDAYATIKLISKDRDRAFMVMNQVRNQKEANSIFDKITTVASNNIKNENFSVELLGKLNSDEFVSKSIKKRILFSKEFPTSLPATDLEAITSNILLKLELKVTDKKKGMGEFFRRILKF
jgi:flagellar biosynthesis protein FlhG